MFDDDYDIDECPCPACGHHVTHSSRCGECDDGLNDLYDDDPINEAPGTYVACGECGGTGIQRWCPKCGADYWHALEKNRRAAKQGASGA